MEIAGSPNLLGPIGDGVLSPIGGSGTINKYAKFTAPTTIGDGFISDDGVSTMTFAATTMLASNNVNYDVPATGGTDTLNFGTSNADVINIGRSGATINIQGNTFYQNVTELQVKDKLFTVNKGGSAGSGASAGFEIEEGGVITGYFDTNGSRDGWEFKAPAISGVANLSLASLTANRTYILPDAGGTIALTSGLTGFFANGGNAFGANASLGTTDNFDLSVITNNVLVAKFTATGNFEFNGGNGTGSNLAIHQTAANVAGTGRIIDIYNNSYNKLLFRVADNGGAGEVYLAAGAAVFNPYNGQSVFTGSAVVRGLTAGGDHLAVTPATGIGGTYFSDASGNPRLYIQNSSAATVIEILSSGVSYLSGGAFDMRTTAGNGYFGMIAQSSNVTAPAAAGLRMFAGATGSFNWVRNNGVADTFVRTFDATLTADRTYTLQDASGTVAFIQSPVFTTQITTPIVYGSSAVSGGLTIDSTSDNTKGPITFGSATRSNSYLFNMGSSTTLISMMGRVGATTNAAMYLAVASGSETNTNYFLSYDGTLRINAQTTTTTINFLCGNTAMFAIQPGNTTSNSFFGFASRARTGLLTTAQSVVYDFGGSTQTWAAGTVPSQYFSYFRANTMAFASASTATLVASVAIDHTAVGSNATFTTATALYVPTATYTSTTTAYSAYFVAPSGATTNWALATDGNVNMINVGTDGIKFQGLVGTTTTSALYLNAATPSSTNFALAATAAGSTLVNGSGNVIVQYAGSNRMICNSGGFNMTGGQGVAGISIFQLTASNNSSQTAGSNTSKFLFTIGTTQWLTGALPQADFVQWTQPSVLFGGASTATIAATMTINGAPIASTNATITTSVGLLISAGTTLSAGATTGYAAYFNAPTGAGTNHALGLAGSLNIIDANNIVIGTSTGTKIGTATGQKIGFWNATPVIQPAAAAQAALAAYVTGAFGLDSDAHMQALYDLVMAMRTALVNTGIMKGAA